VENTDRYLIAYASRTGNTRKLAEAARAVLGDDVDIIPIEEKPSPEGYAWIAVGFWIDQDDANQSVQEYLAELQGRRVALFCTLGTPTEMPAAKQCMEKASLHLGNGCEIMGTFMSQGKVEKSVADYVEKIAEKKGDDKMLRLFQDVIRSAENHPDHEDIKRVQQFFSSFVKHAEI